MTTKKRRIIKSLDETQINYKTLKYLQNIDFKKNSLFSSQFDNSK